MSRREWRNHRETEPERFERIRNEPAAELAKRARHYRKQESLARRLAEMFKGRRK